MFGAVTSVGGTVLRCVAGLVDSVSHVGDALLYATEFPFVLLFDRNEHGGCVMSVIFSSLRSDSL